MAKKKQVVKIHDPGAKPAPMLHDLIDPKLAWELGVKGFATKLDLRNANNGELKDCGLNDQDIKKVRDYCKLPPAKKGDAISLCHLVIRKPGLDTLSVSPGEVIPAEYDSETRVEQGKAIWRE